MTHEHSNVVEGQGGLAKVVIASATAHGEIYLHGAHVTSWKPRAAEEVLFVSGQSRWENGKAIRGGIPICWPWFANRADDPKSPAHGLVRTKAWQLESIDSGNDTVTVCMFTESDVDTRTWWPADFRLEYRVTFGARLALELSVTNAGSAPLRCEEALHTYFRIGAIDTVRLLGLDSVSYLDKTDENRLKQQQVPIVIDAETDRVYLNTSHDVEIEDPVLNRRISIAKKNSLSTVVWNPWIAKAQALSDFGDDEWKQMVCVETCNVGECSVELAPGQRHSMKATIQVAQL